MLRGNLQSKLLEVEISVHIVIHGFADNVGSLQAILLRPLAVEFILCLLGFLLTSLA